MDDLERRLLNRYQGGFPLHERPFDTVAQELGCASDDLIARIGAMLEDGLLSRFGPLFDASSMGGALTLAALEAPLER